MTKFLSSFLQPLAFLWLVLVVAMLWELWHRRWRSALGAGFLAVVLSVIGATPLPARLLAGLERPYAGVQLAALPAADAVVMLGGMAAPSPQGVFGFDLDGEADRVVTALEAARQHKGRALVLGGGWNPHVPNPGEGELLRRLVSAWPVAPVPVHLLGLCRDTRDEAERTRKLAEAQGWKRIILVTSAGHMRRAEATFRRLGLEVVGLPCDFKGLVALQNERSNYLVPGLKGFELLERYLYEQVGWWVYRWRGWL